MHLVLQYPFVMFQIKTRLQFQNVSHNFASATWSETRDENLLWLWIGQRMHGGGLQALWRASEENQSHSAIYYIWHQPVVRFYWSGKYVYVSLKNTQNNAMISRKYKMMTLILRVKRCRSCNARISWRWNDFLLQFNSFLFDIVLIDLCNNQQFI